MEDAGINPDVCKTAPSQNPPFLPHFHSRVISSPSPAPFLVALNFQTPGAEMDLNDGRFLVNGRCGYVLKPAFLRNHQSTFDPEAPKGRAGQRPVALTIKV